MIIPVIMFEDGGSLKNLFQSLEIIILMMKSIFFLEEGGPKGMILPLKAHGKFGTTSKNSQTIVTSTQIL